MTETDNLKIWDALKTPPGEATKAIGGGRLKGKTDINPQWRLHAMTNQFGPCGMGWRYTIEKLWTVPVGPNGEVAAFAEVNVFIRDVGKAWTQDGENWSKPIPGIGGNMLVVKESGGMHINDECFKMAVTDALSVAFKAIGVAADVYMGKFDSKYDQRSGDKAGGGQRQRRPVKDEGLGKCKKCGGFMRKVVLKDGSGRWFLGCQGYPDCKHTTWPDKDEKPKPAPAAAPDVKLGIVGPPRRGAQEVEEMCPLCGNHPINPDGHCPNEHKAEDRPPAALPQEWRPQCCGRTMMPRASMSGEAPRWHCPKCRKTQAMSVEERKRVGL